MRRSKAGSVDEDREKWNKATADHAARDIQSTTPYGTFKNGTCLKCSHNNTLHEYSKCMKKECKNAYIKIRCTTCRRTCKVCSKCKDTVLDSDTRGNLPLKDRKVKFWQIRQVFRSIAKLDIQQIISVQFFYLTNAVSIHICISVAPILGDCKFVAGEHNWSLGYILSELNTSVFFRAPFMLCSSRSNRNMKFSISWTSLWSLMFAN